jgi:RHS repeat-associated protein
MKLEIAADRNACLDAMWRSLCEAMWYSYYGTGYANPDAITQLANGLSTSTFSYDNDGNLVQKTVDGTTTTYVYDYANRLTALGVGGATTTYGYDWAGNRVIQTGTSTTWIYPFKWVSVASSTGSGAKYATTTDYVFNGDTLVSTIDQELASGVATGSAQTRFIHPDHLGSTNVVTDASGTVVQTLDYYPYGSTRISSGQNAESRQYIGQFSDQSALSYLNARYYDGSRGHFLSEDPVFLGDPKQQNLQDPQSLNSYSYSEDNPIVGEDPSGKAVYLVAKPIGWTLGIGTHFYYYISPDPGSRYANIGPFTLSGEPGGQGGSLQTEFGVNGSTGDSARGLPSFKGLYTQLSP